MGVDFQLNGTAVTVRDDHPHLLAALREELDITSPKDGCSPSGQCGCCTVLVDGKAIVSCQQSLAKAAGKSVITLEGVDARRARRVRRRVRRVRRPAVRVLHPGHRHAGQGADRQEGRRPRSRSDMARHLGAHLCRCTGYVKILDAIDAVAKGKQFEPALAATVGGAGAKYEAGELALGDRDYIDDIRVPGMLHAALHLTEHARADIVVDRHRGGGRGARRRRRVHRRRHPRRAARRASSTRTGR